MTTHALRPELPPLPERMKHLPIDHRGYPVPWFAAWVDDAGDECPAGHGKPDHRVIRGRAANDNRRDGRGGVQVAVQQQTCWVCGRKLPLMGSRAGFVPVGVFVIGPMCAINRVSAEPPSHAECADWSARACPFLSRPHARRRPTGYEDLAASPGTMIERNPGVTMVWHARDYRLQAVENGRLFRIGDPAKIATYCEGRPATHAEVMESIDSGYPKLLEAAEAEGPDAVAALGQMRARAIALLDASQPRE